MANSFDLSVNIRYIDIFKIYTEILDFFFWVKTYKNNYSKCQTVFYLIHLLLSLRIWC